FTMKRILIDSGSSDNILYKHAFDQLRIQTDQLKPVKTPLVGITGEMIHPLGSIDLSVVVGTAPHQTQVEMTFLVVDIPSPYNAIIGRPGLNLMEAIVPTRHVLMKFPTRIGVGEARGDQQVARQRYKTAIMDKGKEKVLPITNAELKGDVEPEHPKPVEDVTHVPLEEGNSDKVFQVGSQLGELEKGELITFLQNNKDVFAWSAVDVPGIIPNVIVHKLSMDGMRPPTRQKKRNFSLKRQ
ncbi:Asp_protease_2 domain-containing protein, partial [Cephalotus follicularis]